MRLSKILTDKKGDFKSNIKQISSNIFNFYIFNCKLKVKSKLNLNHV